MSSKPNSKLPLILSSGAAAILILSLIGGGGYWYYTTTKSTTATTTTPPANNTNTNKPTTGAVNAESVTPEVKPLPASGNTSTTPVTPLAPVLTPPTAQQKFVSSFIPAPNIDIAGNDIRCVTDGSDASAARDACGSDSLCVAYNVVAPYGSGAWAKGGGWCLKSAVNNIVAGTPTTLYAAPGAIANPDVVSWQSIPGKDSVGSDLQCWKNGEPLSVAQAACATDSACVAIAQVAGPAGFTGVCKKSAVDTSKLTNNSAVTLYIKPK